MSFATPRARSFVTSRLVSTSPSTLGSSVRFLKTVSNTCNAPLAARTRRSIGLDEVRVPAIASASALSAMPTSSGCNKLGMPPLSSKPGSYPSSRRPAPVEDTHVPSSHLKVMRPVILATSDANRCSDWFAASGASTSSAISRSKAVNRGPSLLAEVEIVNSTMNCVPLRRCAGNVSRVWGAGTSPPVAK